MATCTLTARFEDMFGQRQAGVVIRVFPYQANPGHSIGVLNQDTGALMASSVEAVSNLEGEITLELPQGLWVLLRVPWQQTPIPLIVPSLEEANLFDQLFPRVRSVGWVAVDEEGLDRLDEIEALSLGEGDSIYLALCATYSNEARELLRPLAVESSGDINVIQAEVDRVLVTRTGPGAGQIEHGYTDPNVWVVSVHSVGFGSSHPSTVSISPPAVLEMAAL